MIQVVVYLHISECISRRGQHETDVPLYARNEAFSYLKKCIYSKGVFWKEVEGSGCFVRASWVFWKEADSDRKIVYFIPTKESRLCILAADATAGFLGGGGIFFFGAPQAEVCVCVRVRAFFCLCLLVYVSGGNIATGIWWNHGNGHAESQGHCKS